MIQRFQSRHENWKFLYSIYETQSDNLNSRRGDSMESGYWEQFTKTGKVEDYLRYRSENLRKAEDEKRESVDSSDRYGAVSEPHRGIR